MVVSLNDEKYNLFFLFVCILAYWAIGRVLYPIGQGEFAHLTQIGVTTLIAFAGVGATYERATAPIKVIVRTAIVISAAYVISSHTPVPASLIELNTLAALELNYLWIPALVFGVGGLFRPSLGILPLQMLWWHKARVSEFAGVHITAADYVTIVDTGSFLVCGYLLYVFGRWLLDRPARPMAPRSVEALYAPANENTPHPLNVLALLGVAFHFGNYFYAAIGKAGFGPHPLFWVFENQTPLLTLSGWVSGVLPLSFDPVIVAAVFTGFSMVYVATNLVTFATQFVAFLAFIRVSFVVWLGIFYDIFHLVVFFTTGIFFWKFILLNLSISFGLSRIRNLHLSLRMIFFYIAAVSASPFIFHTVIFAWLDTRSMNHAYFEAVSRDGKVLRVPTNYFLSWSITAAQHRLIWPEAGGFPTETWATTQDAAIMKRGLRCEPPQSYPGLEKANFFMPQEAISEIVRRHHILIMSLVDEDGLYNYDLYPHHLWSMPWEYRDFKLLDKRTIERYRYINESVCLYSEEGRPRSVRKRRVSFDIPITQ